MTQKAPNAFLVGAGPGDPGLITRRGLQLLRSCDVVLYDRLVDPRLLEEVPASAARIFVGKKAGEKSMPQAEIDALVVEHARGGRRVVRLKGGDPFVFGRGADEAQALAAAGIAFEIVPGVSSATGVPAYAGIPVTHSGMSSSFAVLTGHESSDRPGAAERWQDLARSAGTLVLLMGVAKLEETANRLIEAGRDRDEPAAIIERGTTSDQRTVVGSLSTIAELARDSNIEPPAITVVGPVVRLRDALSWYEARPLFGKRVVVTRPRDRAGDLTTRLEELGALVLHVPTIAIADPPSWTQLDEALERLADGGFDCAIFASVNAVERVFDRLAAAGLDARAFAGTRVAAVGPATQRTLARSGLRADVVPGEHTMEALVAALGPGTGPVLLPRPADAPPAAIDALEAAGWHVAAADAYRTVPAPMDESRPASEVSAGRFDVLTLASGSAAAGFVERFGRPEHLGLGGGEPGRAVVCIGPSTATAAESVGFRVDAVAGEHTDAGLAEAIRRLFSFQD